jgi:K+-transporting ATPase KdpF subunit
MIFMQETILLTLSGPVGLSTTAGYVIGAVIALFILGYLVYSLVKPEKF